MGPQNRTGGGIRTKVFQNVQSHTWRTKGAGPMDEGKPGQMIYSTITIFNGISIFLRKKERWKLRPCQDYQYLNDWTIKNAYPLPLISELTDKLAGTKYFTKLDVWWGYNNIRIKYGDQWKAAFKTNKGLFEPTVMFFGMCNSPVTFQANNDGFNFSRSDQRLHSDNLYGRHISLCKNSGTIGSKHEKDPPTTTR